MVLRVGINGFGRIGRVIFRTCLQINYIEISAINDPALTAEYICYLIKFDSTHGKLNKSVSYANDEINVEDHIIKIFHEKMPSSVPWHKAGVQYVIEASGMFTTLDKVSGHMQSDSVKRVIVTAPSVDVPMIILGVNDFKLRSEQKVFSCASSTLYCLAPMIKVLDDEFGISEGFVTSIHAMTPSLKPLDGLCLRGKHWRDYRSIHQNIIPATTGACRALGKVLPQVKDKLAGLAFRVPIVNVSVLDITVRLNTNTTLQDIIKNIEKASKTHMKNIIKISLDETVSSDHIGENHSCIFDLESSLQLKPNFYKLICWYENEYSYACRVIDSIFLSERQLSLVSISSKMTYVRSKPSKKYDVVQQTECLSKEISVECKHSAELCSTYLGTDFQIKESDRNVILKKPLSAHINGKAPVSMGSRETKRRNEIFKIWNDSNDISKSCVRQNRRSFFHSCISFAPKSSNAKPNERLENVKRDISNMSNLTEDLLKKTYNSKAKADADPNFSIDNVNENANTLLNVSQEETTKHKTICNMRTFDTCGDYENRKQIANSQVLDGCIVRIYDYYNKDISNYSTVAKEDASKEGHYKIKKTIHDIIPETSSQRAKTKKLKSESHKTLGADDKSNMLNDDNALTEQVTKAINTLIDGLEQSLNVSCKSDHQNLQINGIRRVKEKFQKNCINEKIGVESKLNSYLDNKNNSMQTLVKENNLENFNADHMVNTTKKEKYNPTIAIDTQHKIKNLNKKLYKKQIVPNPAINNVITETDNEENKKYSAKQILNGLTSVSADPLVMICADNTNARKKVILKVPKQDLYDKLESVSETDSENSFDIHGRKSQVIHITDLTKSLEDLANLDKICKIIEISDELSDKLFSTLISVGGKNLKQKEWSFKDLCERIKLDEFCNKVFGKTAL